MKSVERARRVMCDMGIAGLSPVPSERIIAAALAEARAHGAAVVLVALQTQAKLGDGLLMTKLAALIEEALEIDETVSSEPGG